MAMLKDHVVALRGIPLQGTDIVFLSFWPSISLRPKVRSAPRRNIHSIFRLLARCCRYSWTFSNDSSDMLGKDSAAARSDPVIALDCLACVLSPFGKFVCTHCHETFISSANQNCLFARRHP